MSWGEKKTLQNQNPGILDSCGAEALSSHFFSKPRNKIPLTFKIQGGMFEGFLLCLIATAPSLPSLIFFESPIWIITHSSSLFTVLSLTAFLTKGNISRWFMLGFVCFLAGMGNSAVISESLTLSSEVFVNLCFYGAWFLYVCSVLLSWVYYRIFIVGAGRNGEETSF